MTEAVEGLGAATSSSMTQARPRHGALWDMSLVDSDAMLNVNARVAVPATQAATPHLKGCSADDGIVFGSNMADEDRRGPLKQILVVDKIWCKSFTPYLEISMNHLGQTSSEMAAASTATDPVQREAAAQPVTQAAVPTDAPLQSNPAGNAPGASRTSAPRKALARQPKAVATKKVVAKTVSPRQAKPTESVVMKPLVKKTEAPKKTASAKAGVESTASKKTASVKRAPSKRPVAKKVGPLKRKAANLVVTPAPVSKPAAPATVATQSVKVSPPETGRDAGKSRSKLVRDSFTMPQQDFGLIAALKERALDFKRPTKKSELLRAGLQALQQLTDAKLRAALDSLVPLQAGRPKKKAN